ncbi:MAG: cell division protein SepF [Methanomicrobiales archaeon]|nr:cell division protein SepF [Methanomicrobiales archaeon]MDI6876726.1 cell division protein SepF [Methanomicrobiales archaeon]
MSKLIDTIIGRSSTIGEDDYMELDLAAFEGAAGEEAASMYVKVASIADIRETPRVKDEVYNGNIVIVDISRLKMDKITYERVLKDLKEVARDVNGDIVGLGDQKYIVITPMSVKISREKIGGSLS